MNDYAMWTGLTPADFATLRDDSFTSATDFSAFGFPARGDATVSPSANAFCLQDQPVLPMLDTQVSSERVLLSADVPATDLLAGLLQQQQQMMEADAAFQEEQQIDAQIERLVQLKQVLHMQKQSQQQVVPGAGMTRTTSISLSAAPSLALSTASACSASMAFLDSQLFTGSNSLDLSNGWHASAAQTASQNTRHSMDIGALAHGLAGTNISNSFTFGQNRTAVAAAEAGLQPQPQQGSTSSLLHSTFGSTPNLAALHSPCMDAVPSAPPTSAISDLPLQSSGMLSPATLHLQSSLYAMQDQAASVGFQSWEAPFVGSLAGFNTTPLAPLGNAASMPAAPGSRKCMSIDLRLGATAWPSPAAMTSAFGAASGDAKARVAQATAPTATTTRSAGSGSGQRARRASMDTAPGLTCQGHRAPQKVRSCLASGNSSTAGAACTPAAAQQQQQELLEAAPNKAGAIGHAPKWAGTHWHPMADVVKSGQLANKGTGVFIPGGLRTAA